MADPMFDARLRSLRLARAKRQGEQLFLAERAVEDLADRLSYIARPFNRALIIGCPQPIADRLARAAEQVLHVPGFDDLARFPAESFDLILVLGQLDTADELPAMFLILHMLLAPGGMLAGVFPGNNSLPALRTAMLAADQASGGRFAPRVHPRVEASAVAGLLQQAGFNDPVIEVDRVRMRYRSLDRLIADLRGMGATNSLRSRRPPLTRQALSAARAAFASEGDEGGTVETIELIHFTAWVPDDRQKSSLTAS